MPPENEPQNERRPLLQAVAAQQQQIAILAQQNEMLRAELVVAKSQIADIAAFAGLGDRMANIRTAALKAVEADINNPAQPVEAPPSEAPVQTTEQALEPDGRDNVENQGQTPGVVEGLSADGHDVPYNPGTSLDTPAFNQLVNVEAPVAGTETQRPLSETRTETDVRVGDPTNPQVAFPWTLKSSSRVMASIRLARLQIEAGIANGDDLSLGEKIASTEGLTDEGIAQQIATLSQVRQATASKQRPAGVVPRAAGVARTTPSLTSEASLSTEAAADEGTDEDLFLD